MKNKENAKGFAPILILILLVLIGVGAYYFGTKNKSVSTPVASFQPSSSPLAKPTADPTAGWKTYTNGKVSFKYPESLNLTSSKGTIFLTAQNIQTGKYPAVMFYSMDNPKNLTIQQYDEQMSREGPDPGLYSAYVGSNEVIATQKNLGGVTAYFMKDGNCEPLTCDILSFSYNGKIYIMENIFEATVDNNYGTVDIVNKSAEMRPIFDQILSTFKFTN